MTNQTGSAAINTDHEKLLLVDDDEALTHVLKRAFSRRGFEVIEVHTADEAVKVCGNTKISKAVVDLKLAESSGLQLVPELKLLQPALDIVILTGYSSIATAVEAIKLGAVNYLCKPADADEILMAFGEERAGFALSESEPITPSIDRLEWEHIQRVLAANDNNISATARALGMHRRTLQRKLNKRPVKR